MTFPKFLVSFRFFVLDLEFMQLILRCRSWESGHLWVLGYCGDLEVIITEMSKAIISSFILASRIAKLLTTRFTV